MLHVAALRGPSQVRNRVTTDAHDTCMRLHKYKIVNNTKENTITIQNYKKKVCSTWTYKAVIKKNCNLMSTESPSIRWNECIPVTFDYFVRGLEF